MSNLTYNYDYREAVPSLYLLITRAAIAKNTIKKTADTIAEFVDKYSDLTRKEKIELYSITIKVYCFVKSSDDLATVIGRRLYFDKILGKCRTVQSNVDFRRKQSTLRADMDSGKIFYICSYYDSCADDHKDYQGKIYVDKFWRQKTAGSLYRAVDSYIKNHHTKYVQDVSENPPYLTTRPFCHHKFIPLETETVLKNSAAKLKVKYAAKNSPKLFGKRQYNSLRKTTVQIVLNVLEH